MTSVVSQLGERPVQKAREAYEAEIDALIRATVEAAADSPTCDVTVTQILQATGLSTTTFYRHFSSKEELWLAILRYGRELVLARLMKSMAEQSTPDGAVRAWIDCIVEQARRPAAARRTRAYALARPRLLFQFPDAVKHSDRTLMAPLVEAVAHGRDSGAYPHAVPEADSGLIFLLVQDFTNDYLLTNRKPTPESVEHLHQVVLAVLTRTAGAPR